MTPITKEEEEQRLIQLRSGNKQAEMVKERFESVTKQLVTSPSIVDIKTYSMAPEGNSFEDYAPKTALKNDQEKIPLDLLPFESLEEVGKVLKYGAEKYDAHNWRKGLIWSRLIGAALRHVFAFARGEDKDPETGYSHLAHAACCILFLLSYTITNNGTDDRVKV